MSAPAHLEHLLESIQFDLAMMTLELQHPDLESDVDLLYRINYEVFKGLVQSCKKYQNLGTTKEFSPLKIHSTMSTSHDSNSSQKPKDQIILCDFSRCITSTRIIGEFSFTKLLWLQND